MLVSLFLQSSPCFVILLYFALLVMLVVLCPTIFIERKNGILPVHVQWLISLLQHLESLHCWLWFCTIHVFVLDQKTDSYTEVIAICDLHTCLVVAGKSGSNYIVYNRCLYIRTNSKWCWETSHMHFRVQPKKTI